MITNMKEYRPEESILFRDSVRFNKDLSWGEKVFLAEMQSITKKGKCQFSSREMKNLFGVSHQTILNWVKKLVTLGLIEVGLDYATAPNKFFLVAKDCDQPCVK
jgi:predicted AAA+ superfamily ATPase